MTQLSFSFSFGTTFVRIICVDVMGVLGLFLCPDGVNLANSGGQFSSGWTQQ